MKRHLCSKDWDARALLNSDVWTLHMHISLCLIYFKPPPSVLLSACEFYEISVSWFAGMICARQENKHTLTSKENQPILKLCSLLLCFEGKSEFCGVFYPWLQYFGQLLSGFNMVRNAQTGNLILQWLFASLDDTPINQTPAEWDNIQNNYLCQTNGVRMDALCCRPWPGVQKFGALFLAVSHSLWW